MNRTAVLDTSHITTAADSKSLKHIVIAEDSPFLNTLIVNTLHEAGYQNVVSFDNGKDAWDYISGHKDAGNNITDEVACLISDIEMPKMDGHHLTKLIKDDEVLRRIPVYLFSSLINDQMRKKGESVGANAQFSKPQIGSLIAYINDNI
jgi:two-component system chemotaxis response regulator CheV